MTKNAITTTIRLPHETIARAERLGAEFDASPREAIDAGLNLLAIEAARGLKRLPTFATRPKTGRPQ